MAMLGATYSMADPKLVQSVRQKAHSVASMISAYYRMQVEPPPIRRPEDWSLTINQEIQKHARPCLSFIRTNSGLARITRC